jgi:hypothetical protein
VYRNSRNETAAAATLHAMFVATICSLGIYPDSALVVALNMDHFRAGRSAVRGNMRQSGSIVANVRSSTAHQSPVENG